MPDPSKVILVDGVGNGVITIRDKDCLMMTIGKTVFVKTKDQRDGMDVYRLKGTAGPNAPAIRHVGRYSATGPTVPPRVGIEGDHQS